MKKENPTKKKKVEKKKTEKGYNLPETAINAVTGEKVPLERDFDVPPEILEAIKEALKKPRKIGDITEGEILNLMQTNLSRRDAIHEIFLQRMQEARVISNKSRRNALKVAEDKRNSNLNKLLKKLIKDMAKRDPMLPGVQFRVLFKLMDMEDSKIISRVTGVHGEDGDIVIEKDATVRWFDKNDKPLNTPVSAVFKRITRICKELNLPMRKRGRPRGL